MSPQFTKTNVCVLCMCVLYVPRISQAHSPPNHNALLHLSINHTHLHVISTLISQHSHQVIVRSCLARNGLILLLSRFMGSRSHPHRVLSVCVCVCVSRCLWVCVIEADSLQLRVITVGLYLFLSRSLLCQILAVFAVVVYTPFWFRDS